MSLVLKEAGIYCHSYGCFRTFLTLVLLIDATIGSRRTMEMNWGLVEYYWFRHTPSFLPNVRLSTLSSGKRITPAMEYEALY